MTHCPLCMARRLREFHRDRRREYLQCGKCGLISVPLASHLSPAAEKAEYDKHQNDPADPGYRRFLSRTLDPLWTRLPRHAQGLDFGCGPGPAVSAMAAERGIQVSDYDPYYFEQPELLERRYDFVVMTEVIEHIAAPRSLLMKLDGMLQPQGLLAIMTKRVTDREAFARWHYKNDPTHICFYSRATFEWVGGWLNWRLEVIDKDVVFFHKSAAV